MDEDSGSVESESILSLSEVDRLHVDKVTDQPKDLSGIIWIVGVVLQGIDGDVVDQERSALYHVNDGTLGNRPNAGGIAVPGGIKTPPGGTLPIRAAQPL